MSAAPLFELHGSLGSNEMGVLAVTHARRPPDELGPDRVYVIVDGRIVGDGGPELSTRCEAEGYERFGVSA